MEKEIEEKISIFTQFVLDLPERVSSNEERIDQLQKRIIELEKTMNLFLRNDWENWKKSMGANK